MILVLVVFAAAVVYALVVLASPVHACPRCKGQRVEGGRRPRTCRKCKGRGLAARPGSARIHRLAWSVAGPHLRRRLGDRLAAISEKTGMGE